MKPLVIFAHGKESGPWGSKICYLAEIAARTGADVSSPDYTALADPDARVAYLLSLPEITNRAHDPMILVGSSMGAYVSAVASCKLQPQGLFLLAPAIGIPGYAVQHPSCRSEEIEIVMGWNDAVIPITNVVHFAAVHKARLHLLRSDHRLNDALIDIGFIFESFLQRVIGQ